MNTTQFASCGSRGKTSGIVSIRGTASTSAPAARSASASSPSARGSRTRRPTSSVVVPGAHSARSSWKSASCDGRAAPSGVTSDAPARSSERAAPRPRSSGSSSGVASTVRPSTRAPSALSTLTVSPTRPPRRSQSAATGAAQPAPSSARTARSAVAAKRVSGSSRSARASTISDADARHSTARAPWAGAGSRLPSTSEIAVPSPSRRRPAAASTTASRSASGPVARASRVPTLPRISTIVRSGRSAFSCAARRGDPVPTRAPWGSDDSRVPGGPQSTSCQSSRAGTAAIVRPGTPAVGRSFIECTAMSTSPASRASRRAAAKTPAPPWVTSEPVMTSPEVLMVRISTSCPSARRLSATMPDWVSASCEPRVPRTILMGPPYSRPGAARSRRRAEGRRRGPSRRTRRP